MAKYRRICVSLAVAWGLALGPALARDGARPADNDAAWSLCAATAAEVEAEQGLPAHILTAVSLAETGRAGPGRQIAAWPWTVHDGTRGYHFATEQEAVDFVREIRTDGRRSIDVGCMQINLRHHPRAFTSVRMGFDAKANIEYAAAFLKDLASKSRSWEEAIAKYHTQNPTLDEDYAPKVLAFWRREKARGSDAAQGGKMITAGSVSKGRILAMRSQPVGHDARLVLAAATPGPELTLRTTPTSTAPTPITAAVMTTAPMAAVPMGETGALRLRPQFGSAP